MKADIIFKKRDGLPPRKLNTYVAITGQTFVVGTVFVRIMRDIWASVTLKTWITIARLVQIWEQICRGTKGGDTGLTINGIMCTR